MASPLYAVKYCVVYPSEGGRLAMSCGKPVNLASRLPPSGTVCAIEYHPDGRMLSKCDKSEKIKKTLSKLK